MADKQKTKLRLEIAHILFIDIVGYSKLSIDEQRRAIERLTEVVQATEEFQEAESAKRLVKIPTGDGMALVFYDSPEAPVECAMEVSRKLSAPHAPRVRMGIHSGPVSGVLDVNGRGNVAGDGINTAQRVMSFGDAGHILLSRRVAQDLSQFKHWRSHLHDLGECEAKHGVRIGLVNLFTSKIGNSDSPSKLEYAPATEAQAAKNIPSEQKGLPWLWLAAAALVLLALVGAIFFLRGRASQQPAGSIAHTSEKSIAILPFENLSRDPDNAYFADGIQDEILTRLSKIADLKVISRTSTQHYKSAPQNLPEIARQLGVAHIVEGSVQKSGDAVRVNVQLIRAANDSHLWAETFDRKLTDIFAVESEVATAVADKLEAKITGGERRAVTEQPTANPEAYDAYLRGLATHFTILDLGRLQNAEKHFRRAVELDPGFGLAWARLADVHSIFYFADFDATKERREAARTAAETAQKLAPESGEAYLALGEYRLRCERNFDLAAEALEKARQRLPNDAEPLLELGAVAMQRGQVDEARSKERAALAMDPRNPATIRRNGVFEAYSRRVSEAHAYIDRALDITPDDSALIALKADIYQSEGNLAAAEQMLARLPAQLGPERVPETCSRMRQLIYQHRYDAVISSLQPIVATPALSIGIRLSEYHILMALAQQLAGNIEAAHDTYEKGRDFLLGAIAKSGETQGRVHAMLGQMYAGLGQKSLALREANIAIELEGEDQVYGPATQEALARIKLQLGEKGGALEQLPQLLTARYHSWFYFVPLTPALLRLDPTWEPLRGDPRFEKLVSGAPK